ncbi:MAG: hypothetical protein K0S74_442 [Chlamydiales bacterium]|jgi:ankyrin repeat protein|nr:hypothetical protein [Chlamydiales bacterium]
MRLSDLSNNNNVKGIVEENVLDLNLISKAENLTNSEMDEVAETLAKRIHQTFDEFNITRCLKLNKELRVFEIPSPLREKLINKLTVYDKDLIKLFIIAKEESYEGIVKTILIAPGFDTIKMKCEAFIEAAEKGYLDVVEQLIKDPKVNESAKSQAIIKAAVGHKPNHIAIIKLLLEDGVDPSIQNNQPIRTAASSGSLEIFNLLLVDKRVDPSDQDNIAIQDAATAGPNDYIESQERDDSYLAIVQMLVKDSRVDPSANNNAAIKAAAYHDRMAIVELLLNDQRVFDSLIEDEELSIFLADMGRSIRDNLNKGSNDYNSQKVFKGVGIVKKIMEKQQFSEKELLANSYLDTDDRYQLEDVLNEVRTGNYYSSSIETLCRKEN